MEKVLIIGGTGGLAKTIINRMELAGDTVELLTFRQEFKKHGDYNWTHLDLENTQTVNNFLKFVSDNKYDKIILIASNTLGNGIDGFDYNRLRHYHESYYLNYIYIVSELYKVLSDHGQMVFISSMAANIAIPDANYSAMKAGLQAFIKSSSCSLKEKQIAYSISPGLIFDTQAFYDSNYQGDISKLATKEQIAEIIANCNYEYNGKVFEIGY